MNFFPNAKINIGLNVIEKRKDGFHNIESVFVPINWTDEIEIIESAETKFTSKGIKIPGEASENLCLKAYYLLKLKYHLPEVNIHLRKNIPIGAGLGGGSADAAFVLKGLNHIFDLKISDDELVDFARLLGSDCAFFIRNKVVLATDKGDIFHPIQVDLRDYYMVLIYPNIHVNTAEAYQGIKVSKANYDLKDVMQLPISDWKRFVRNDFETTVFKKYPQLFSLKSYLYDRGAIYAAMSGSGSTVYGIFESIPPKIEFTNSKIHIANMNYLGALYNK